MVDYRAVMKTDGERADSRQTRHALIDAVGLYVDRHAKTPERLADVAVFARVATATAYRHFDSIDHLIEAFIMRFPLDVAARAQRLKIASGHTSEAVARLHRWNRAWVITALELGTIATALRSREGFLARRERGDPVVVAVCQQVEPLLAALGPNDLVYLLALWNVITDPREVLDLHAVLGWSAQRIARSCTDAVVANANM
jgi:AcrR family transcriptional regulator